MTSLATTNMKGHTFRYIVAWAHEKASGAQTLACSHRLICVRKHGTVCKNTLMQRVCACRCGLSSRAANTHGHTFRYIVAWCRQQASGTQLAECSQCVTCVHKLSARSAISANLKLETFFELPMRSLPLAVATSSHEHCVCERGGEPIAPVLPRRHDFATLTGAVPHSPRAATLHSLAMSGWLQLRSQPWDARPPVPARVAVPKRSPARPRDNGLPQDRPLFIADVHMQHPWRIYNDLVPDVADAEGALNVFTAD